jgi:lysophospholipid acyltransferase (LPLAT)-like uncharacterized protein
MSVTVLNPRIHLVKDTNVAKFFRRKLGEEDVMTFWHSQTGMWILAFWMHKGKRIVEEIEDLGPNFEAVSPGFVQMIVQCYGPVNFKAKKKRILSRERNTIRKQNEAIMEDQERWDWLKKKTKDKAPIPYAFSTPMSGGAVLPPRTL